MPGVDMQRGTKFALTAFVAALVLTLVVAFLVAAFVAPVFENHEYYCFYCGQQSTACRILGIPAGERLTGRSLYSDTVPTPPHDHHPVEICGYWILLTTSENWDEFGSTGMPCRMALVTGLQRVPGQQAEIFREFMALDPRDEPARLRFIVTHGDSASVHQAQLKQTYLAILPQDTQARARFISALCADTTAVSDSVAARPAL